MSRFLTTGELDELERLLSRPRLGTYLDLTASRRSEDAVELHQATMSLGVALMAVTSSIEVALRNAVCHELNQTFAETGWLRNPPATLTWAALERDAIRKAERQAQRAVYSKMPASRKAALDEIAFPRSVPNGIKHRKLARKRQETITTTDGQVVAQLTLYFWKRLFSEQYEQTLWKRAVKRVFPNKTITRAEVAEHLETLYETRNRLAHHEPVYGARLKKILYSIDFVTSNLGCIRPTRENAFSKLIMPQRDILAGQVAIFQATYERLANQESQ